MSENTYETPESTTAEESPEAAASRAMSELMADNTALLTAYLQATAARIKAEREVEDLAKVQWTAWRALTSSRQGGFSEAQLKRQSIVAPAPTPRRDRGKKRATKRTASAAQSAQTETNSSQDNERREQANSGFGS